VIREAGMTADPLQSPAHAVPRLEPLLAAAVFLMSACARDGGGPQPASVVLGHLESIAEGCDPQGVLGATCEQVADNWVRLARSAACAAPTSPPRTARAALRARLRLVVGGGVASTSDRVGPGGPGRDRLAARPGAAGGDGQRPES
jgi:hypothetical protein